MRKRVHIAVAFLLVAMAGVVAWQVFRSRQPTYQGKTLLFWLEQHSENSSPSDQNRAAYEAAEIALRHIGTNALPTLSAWAGWRDSPFRKKTLTLLSGGARVKLGVYSANDYHAIASYGFGVLKSMAKPAVPGLIQLLNDTDPDTRAGAAWCLCRMGPAADEAVPALLQCLDDPATRNNAFAALRSISAKPDVVVPVLIGHLSAPTKGQQGWALYCLSEFGADAKTAVPSVLKLLDDSYPYLRQAATNALKKIDPDAAAKAGVK